MNRIITIFLLLLFCKTASSQSIERELVASNGTTLINGGFQLSYSLGEVAILATANPNSSTTFFATIGFQQPHVAKIGQVLPPVRWVSAYPNPAVSIVRLDIHGMNFQPADVKVFNALGQLVTTPFTFINGSIEVKLGHLAAGTYIISVTDKETGSNISSKIIKQNN